MRKDQILQSDLLDILFDNRNKEYGAYVLRRDYEHRLRNALFIMLGALLILTVWVTLSPVPELDLRVTVPGGNTLKEFNPQPDPPKPQVQRHIQPVQQNPEDLIPVITKDSIIKIINKPVINTPGEPGDLPPGTDPGSGGGGSGGGGEGPDSSARKTDPPKIPVVTVIDKEQPIYSPDVMPEFPGGVAALVKYFKKNLTAPEEVAEGEKIQVKVNFVVRFDGTLASFKVIQSGGEAFDKEVLRVLKKMPNWIPGRTSGKEVSVYFTVPVVFTSDL